MNQAVMDSNFNNQLVLNFHWLVLKFHWIFIIEYELVQDIIKKHVYMQKWEKKYACFFTQKQVFAPRTAKSQLTCIKFCTHLMMDWWWTDLWSQMCSSVRVKTNPGASYQSVRTRHWTVEEVDVLTWPVFHSLLLFSAWLTRLSSKLHIDWRHKPRQDVLSAVRLSRWAGLMSNMVRLALSASLYRLRGPPRECSPCCNWP